MYLVKAFLKMIPIAFIMIALNKLEGSYLNIIKPICDSLTTNIIPNGKN